MTRLRFAARTIRSRSLSHGVAALGLGALLVLVLLGDRSAEGIATAVVAVAAAMLVVALIPTRPRAAFGTLLLLSSISKLTIDIQAGNLRLEQPAILAAIAMILLSRRWPRAPELRPALVVGSAFAAYLAILTLSSVLYAPQFATSARMIIWTGLSMSGGAVAFTLLARKAVTERTSEFGWFSLTGFFHATVGLVVAVLFLAAGPGGIPGMQVSPGELPKVAGLAWEANIYASLLAALAPFALERFRAKPHLGTLVPAALIIVAMGLGVTRGAYLGLAVGLAVYFLILLVRLSGRVQWKALAAVIIAASVMAPVTSGLLLPWQRQQGGPQPSTGLLASASPGTSLRPGQTAVPTRAPVPTPTAVPPPTPVPPPDADTLTFRLDRVSVALDDVRRNPIIGLGAATFGQRHTMPDRPDLPDYIGILALVALYESGILGAVSLGGGFCLVLWLLFDASKRQPGRAAAYAGSIVSLLVAYQATNALFFSFIWLIVGAALAFVVRSRRLPAPPMAEQVAPAG